MKRFAILISLCVAGCITVVRGGGGPGVDDPNRILIPETCKEDPNQIKSGWQSNGEYYEVEPSKAPHTGRGCALSEMRDISAISKRRLEDIGTQLITCQKELTHSDKMHPLISEISSINPEMKFGKLWDEKRATVTREVFEELFANEEVMMDYLKTAVVRMDSALKKCNEEKDATATTEGGQP